jgi:CDP-diacylglycerol--inositol 3-phosphatidyltransferase
MSSFFFVANFIGYLRVICLLFAASLSNNTETFLAFYVVSYALDAIDGPVARAISGTSKLGSVLDMVTDRASTAILLALLQDPAWLLLLILDVSAHWIHTSASLISGKSSHKDTKDAILQWYYKRSNLFTVCLFSEAFLCGCFLLKRGVNVPLELIVLSSPAFFLKQSISFVHLWRGSQYLASLDS